MTIKAFEEEKVTTPGGASVGLRSDEGAEQGEPEGRGISRRKFLKILGAASAAGVAGCADPAREHIYPYVKGEREGIPGVPVWYNSTCTECSAGCGIQVRTREGRAVKLEGNPLNPVNRGGLCALGQAGIQAHYDPDRVRQPLLKDSDGSFKPVSWEEAYAQIAEALNDKKTKKVFVTGEYTGALEELTADLSKQFNIERAVYDLTQPVAVAKAAELVYGTYGVPTYSLDKADVILNFGADFLETWVSPVQYAKDWARSKKAEKPLRFIHVEPRLSLTGANADMWVNANVGTEVRLALAIVKQILERGKGENLRDDIRGKLAALTKDVDVDKVAEETGVSRDKIVVIADHLAEAKSPLVLCGGAAASTQTPLPLMVLANFMNSLLMSVGKTVHIGALRKPRTSLSAMRSVIDTMNKGEVGLLMVHGTNPAFTLPSSYGFIYGAKKIPLVVSFSSHLDETAQIANLVLPSSSPLESWSDVRTVSGTYGLVQPAMSPIFDTKATGDILLEIAGAAGNTAVAGGSKSFYDYLKASWKKLQGSVGASGDFEKFWLESVERGGYYPENSNGDHVKVEVRPAVFDIKFDAATFDRKDVMKQDLVLYPFPSVKTFDGRAANRPWLQELPDPITQIVWDQWAEIHPETAKQHGIAFGDFVTIRNYYGELDVPAYLTEHVNRGIIAVPIGQGHSSYGRFAKKVSGGNVLELLPPSAAEGVDAIALASTRVSVKRGRGAPQLVITQGHDTDEGRGIARTTLIASAADLHKPEKARGEHGAEEASESEGGEHERKQMYVQREHPFYKWGMNIDLAACTGCSACVVACYAENNIPVVGKNVVDQGREMSWLTIQRYYDGSGEELVVNFLPMMCQHCQNAPCEPVCPVYATYHNEEGLNSMVYNRCVGTRYCSNNCSYKVRRFNWFEYDFPEPLNMQLNPDVTRRVMGVMEKCTFCIQRINQGRDLAKDLGRPIQDGDIKPACVQSCPTEALTFGNLNDPNSAVNRKNKQERAYKVLDEALNTQPSVTYLPDVKYKV